MIGNIRTVFWIGVTLLFLSFLGIPDTWKMIVAFLFALVLMFIAFRLRHEYRLLRKKIRTLEHHGEY